MGTTRATLIVLGALLAVGCADTVPDSPYLESCTTDAQCAPDYSCLLWSSTTGPRMVCSRACTTASECPPSITQHCGDLTTCDNGVCGTRFCR